MRFRVAADSHATDFVDPLSTNEFHAVSGITVSPFQVYGTNSVTIGGSGTSFWEPAGFMLVGMAL